MKCEEVAEFVWQRRAEFQVALPGPEEAVRQALKEGSGLTVLVDVGDNLGAGTPGWRNVGEAHGPGD